MRGVTGARVRVASLVPSVTETLRAWGVEPVACTRFCPPPCEVTVGGTKDPDVAAIVRLAPDLVVMNDEENRAEDAAALRAEGLVVHVVRVRSVEEVAPAMADLAVAAGLPSAPSDAAPSTPSRLAPPAPRLRAFVPIWRRPWMTLNGDTYGSSLLQAIGVVNVFADHPDRYPAVSLADAAARGPDVVLAPSEPYPFGERQRAELEQVAPMVAVDGQDLFWWGARTPSAMVRLDAVLAGVVA